MLNAKKIARFIAPSMRRVPPRVSLRICKCEVLSHKSSKNTTDDHSYVDIPEQLSVFAADRVAAKINIVAVHDRTRKYDEPYKNSESRET
jgi:hypothetical protein